MNTNLLIVSTFLVFSLIHGLLSGRKVNTFTKFAIGNKNFRTSTLVATIISTYFGSTFLSQNLKHTYINGLSYALIILITIAIHDLIISHLITIRMKEFLHHYSIAESMGALFGNRVRMITALVGILFCVEVAHLQLESIIKMSHC